MAIACDLSISSVSLALNTMMGAGCVPIRLTAHSSLSFDVLTIIGKLGGTQWLPFVADDSLNKDGGWVMYGVPITLDTERDPDEDARDYE